MSKRVVFYDPSQGAIIPLGSPAIVFPVNHDSPLVSNTKHARTSNVIQADPDTGVFETENTIYKPCDGLKEVSVMEFGGK